MPQRQSKYVRFTKLDDLFFNHDFSLSWIASHHPYSPNQFSTHNQQPQHTLRHMMSDRVQGRGSTGDVKATHSSQDSDSQGCIVKEHSETLV